MLMHRIGPHLVECPRDSVPCDQRFCPHRCFDDDADNPFLPSKSKRLPSGRYLIELPGGTFARAKPPVSSE